MNLTKNETALLRAMLPESNFTGNELDFTKDWNEQELDGLYWEAFCDISEFEARTGMSGKVIRGVISSLIKKNLIEVQDDCPTPDGTNYIIIGEDEFNNLKALNIF